ncbi:GtrA family protein [Saprospiraceae bacterium]|nr:GtrA family protein [Saprospiraceae bacterium]
MSKPKVPFFISFIRSQIAAFAATIGDFSSLYLLQEGQVYHNLLGTSDARSLLLSTATASILGAVISFTLGRTWAFKRKDKPILQQAIKYAIASTIIALINVGGMHVLSNVMGNSYMLSKAFIAVLTGVFVSFPLFRYWVFR